MTGRSPAPYSPHRMHLRGPWEYEWLTDHEITDAGNAVGSSVDPHRTGRVKMPAAWQTQFGPLAGCVRFRRRFHRPSNLEAHERIVVAFDGIGGTARISLNGRALDAADRFVVDSPSTKTDQQPLRYEITGLLMSANELVVEIDFDPAAAGDAPGGLWGAVAIEVW